MAQQRKSNVAKGSGVTGAVQAPVTEPQRENGASSQVVRNGDLPPGLRTTVASLAYELYERRGRADGYDVEDWLKAEALIGSQDR